jgi:crossover junction endodeoxyribonuclease RuvC
MVCVEYGVITTDSAERLERRLSKIFEAICGLIEQYGPTHMAMESVFVNTNPRSSEKLIMARTAAFLAIAKGGLVVNEYPPSVVKKSVTGLGHASKAQVHVMVQRILRLAGGDVALTADSADALAVAICHSFSPLSLQ